MAGFGSGILPSVLRTALRAPKIAPGDFVNLLAGSISPGQIQSKKKASFTL